MSFLFLHIDTDAPPVWTTPGSWFLTSRVYSNWLVNRHLDRTLFAPFDLRLLSKAFFIRIRPRVVSQLAEWNEGSSQILACGRLSSSGQPCKPTSGKLGTTICACAAKQRQDCGEKDHIIMRSRWLRRSVVTGSMTLNTGAQQAWMKPTIEMALFGM